MKILHIITFVSYLLLLPGCVTNSGPKTASGKLLLLEYEISVPEEVYYYGPDGENNIIQEVLSPLGSLLGDITPGGIEGGGAAIEVYLEKTGIDVEEIFVEVLREELPKSQYFWESKFGEISTNTDGKIALEIVNYGFTQTHGFSEIYYPLVVVRVYYYSQNGDLLRKKHGGSAFEEGLVKEKMSYFTENPENMREALEISFRVAVRKALEKF